MSDKQEVIKKAKKYLGADVNIKPSTRKDKKFMVENPKGKMVHFGAKGYDDYTKHKDDKRRQNYLSRATAIKGDWKKDKYSPNNLAINILW
uniref:Uncharacterized protein n=1 Tax=viral metagenome TaxID=1070528 RepID=A0A6C0JTG4_9ZZZZ